MLYDLTEKHFNESKKILSFTKQEVKEGSQVRESRLPVGMFSAVPANLHRWHMHTDEWMRKWMHCSTGKLDRLMQLWEKLT